MGSWPPRREPRRPTPWGVGGSVPPPFSPSLFPVISVDGGVGMGGCVGVEGAAFSPTAPRTRLSSLVVDVPLFFFSSLPSPHCPLLSLPHPVHVRQGRHSVLPRVEASVRGGEGRSEDSTHSAAGLKRSVRGGGGDGGEGGRGGGGGVTVHKSTLPTISRLASAYPPRVTAAGLGAPHQTYHCRERMGKRAAGPVSAGRGGGGSGVVEWREWLLGWREWGGGPVVPTRQVVYRWQRVGVASRYLTV